MGKQKSGASAVPAAASTAKSNGKKDTPGKPGKQDKTEQAWKHGGSIPLALDQSKK